ncbi:MAG: sensor histidine kinase, partial [Christensenellaceae bacterium]|nr:sensor histidine kinase [Christensenellaceae bacterium]
ATGVWMLCGLTIYLLLAGLLYAFWRQSKKLQESAKALADGRFDCCTDTKGMFASLKAHGQHLNNAHKALSGAIETSIKSERMKAELITNVSHDIKTPLTAIIGYVDLLRKQPLDAESAGHVAVLERQAQRLKKMTEDLIEASKASTGNIPVQLSPINAGELLEQAGGEYADRLLEKQLELKLDLPCSPTYMMADGKLLWRVLDNLLSNILKHAMSGTRVYGQVKADGENVCITLKNISAFPLNIGADQLMERFVQGDSSRATEGSGLGLSIALSLTELQGGHFDLTVDGDLFKVSLSLPACPAPAE